MSDRHFRLTQLAELAARIESMPWQWVGQELPQFSSAPTDHAGVLSSAGIGMRLFTVAQRGGYAPMIGGVGYVLAPGPAAYTLKTVAAKDVWVRPTERARAETVNAAVGCRAPVKTGAGTWGVSSPRVLSDLFWMGRYGERAENMARLLIVARDRFHVYRHHQDTEESECVPVLMAALGQHHRNRHRSGQRPRRDDRHRPVHAVVADRRPEPAGIA